MSKYEQHEEDEDDDIVRPMFTGMSNIPGILHNGQYYITYMNFLMFVNYYEFPDEFVDVFNEIMNQAGEFIEADLEPYIVWDINRKAISATSAEYLQGRFVQ